MLENLYTTKMSGDKKALQSRFSKIRQKNSRASKIIATVSAVALVGVLICAAVVMAVIDSKKVMNEIVVDGKNIKLEEEMYYEGETLMVPVKSVGEALDASVKYSEESGSLYIKRNLKHISATVGAARITPIAGNTRLTTDEEIILPAAIVVRNGCVMAPVAMFEAVFDVSGSWNNKTGMFEIELSDMDKQVQLKKLEKNYSDKNGNLILEATAVYPYLVNEEYPEAAGALNAKIEAEAQEFFKGAAEYADMMEAEGYVPPEWRLSTQDMGFEVSYYDGEVICYYISEYHYGGGAHGMPYARGFTYSLKENRELTAADLVDLQGMDAQAFVQSQFMNIYRSGDERFYPNAEYDIMREDFSWDEYLGEDGYYYFIVPPYQLGPYAAGFIDCKVPVKAGILKKNN